MRIADKISLYFLIVVFVLAGIAAPVFYLTARDSLKKLIYDSLSTVVVSRTEHIKTYLRMLELSVEQLSKSKDLEHFLKVNGKEDSGWYAAFELAMRRLEIAKEVNSAIAEFLLMDRTGRVVAYSNEGSVGLDRSSDVIFLGGKEETTIKDVYYSKEYKGFLIAVSTPLFDRQTQEFLGVVAVRVRSNDLNNIVAEKTGLGETGEIYIVNEDGYMVTPSRFEEGVVLKKRVDVQAVSSGRAYEGREDALSGKIKINIFHDYRGAQVIGAQAYIPQMRWVVLAEIRTKEAFSPLVRLRLVFIAILFIVPIAAWLLGIFMARSTIGPLLELYKGAEIIGSGNFDHKVGTDTKDEVGQLSRAFNQMTQDLKKTTTSIGSLNKEVAERKQAQDDLRKKALELDASLKDALKSRDILTSMLEDNNKSREKIVQSEATFRNIFEDAADGILVVDTESQKFTMSNRAICRMLGYSHEEIKNLGILDIHPEKDLPYVMDQFQKQLQAKAKDRVLSSDLSVKKKDGSVFHADVSLSMIDISGKPYVMGLFHDLTEHREVEDLRKIDKLKKDFISNMSHELRTPLNAVIGFSEILADQKFGALNETQKDYLNDILESGKFLLSLINDILDLAKIESGKMELVTSDFSLGELLKHSLIFVKEKALLHHIGFSLEIEPEVGYIRADERKVRQIVFNLLSNAVKFTPDGGKVGINAKINGSEVEVAVWDTGIGVPTEDQDKLFRPFVQIEPFLNKHYEGTGLGLSLTREFVKLHRGKIWVESEGRGKGSSFKFILPVRARQ